MTAATTSIDSGSRFGAELITKPASRRRVSVFSQILGSTETKRNALVDLPTRRCNTSDRFASQAKPAHRGGFRFSREAARALLTRSALREFQPA